MSGQFSRGWKRMGRAILHTLQTLVTVEDADTEPVRRNAAPIINPATGFRMVGGRGGRDTSGHRYGQGVTMTPKPKR
jgi:hypothetical protein